MNTKEVASIYDETISKCLKDREYAVNLFDTIRKQYDQAAANNDEASKVVAVLSIISLNKILNDFGIS